VSSQDTVIACVIGSPIVQSLSPVIHNAAFAYAGRVGVYTAVETSLDECASVVARMRKLGVRGLSVTMPLKTEVIHCLDALDVTAKTLNAVNCVSIIDGIATGYNTDGDGCCDALLARSHSQIDGATAVVLGAGGTARSVALAMLRRGARVIIINRTDSTAHELVALLSSFGEISVGTESDITSATIVVNATSVGMHTSQTAISGQFLHADLVVLDAVYSPLNTKLLTLAEQAGATVIDGLWMLIYQAVRQQEIWFTDTPKPNVMRTAAEQELARRAK